MKSFKARLVLLMAEITLICVRKRLASKSTSANR